MTGGVSDLMMSILMAAGFLLTGTGIWMFAKGRDRKRGGLMIVAGLVMFANVAIWTVPTV